jgi:hypothetical protein
MSQPEFIWSGVAGLTLWRHKAARYYTDQIFEMALRRAPNRRDEGPMTRGILLLAAGAMIAASLAPASAEQLQYDRRTGKPVYNNNPNVVYNQGRTRIYVSKRSWLDGGTEVLPGDRKFTDYAYPPGRSFATENNNRPLDRQPLNPASDLGGYPTRIPLYPD